MANRTRMVHLRTGSSREDAENAPTQMCHGSPLLPPSPPAGFAQLFKIHYQALRAIREGFRQPGLALVAADSNSIHGHVCFAAKPDRINAAVIGRHGMADLYLDSDPTLSLRHLMVILYPCRAGEDLRFRVLDLRTMQAFFDENGRRLEALEAEGPVFLRCGHHALFVLPIGDDLPWPEDPEDGWACIPERVYLDDALAEPDRQRRQRQAVARRRQRARARGGGSSHDPDSDALGKTTMVEPFSGPAPANRALVDDHEEPLGEFRIRGDRGCTSISVGRRAAREGVLFGRYSRCDNEGLPALTNPAISRVHLLTIQIAGQLYAVDTASTNGLFADGQEVRLLPLDYDQRLVLSQSCASLQWCVLN